MASTTKIMTLIVALENGNINDTVKITRRAASAPPVKMKLSTNEEIKLEYLLYALMLQSYNDSAVAIAEHISGSVEEFCKLMTQKAKEIGAFNTSFETPSGLDAENHYSTAYDMGIIARYALQNEDFLRITNTPSLDVTSNKSSYHLQNKNRLLTEVHGAKGVKTGFTGKAGHCFVGAVERDELSLISVVLGSGWGGNRNQKWIDTKEILSYGFKEFELKDLINKGEIAGSVNIGRSKTANIDLEYGHSLKLPLSKNEHVEIELKHVKDALAPINEGDVLGVAKIYINNRLENTIDLIATETAERHDLQSICEKLLKNLYQFYYGVLPVNNFIL